MTTRSARRARLRLIVIALLVLASVGPRAIADDRTAAAPQRIEPLLWRVHTDTATMYLYGSIHVAPDEAIPPPMVVREAFSRAGTLVSEVLLGDDLTTRLAQVMAERSVLPEGRTLRDLFSDDEWQIVHEWAAGVGIPDDELLQAQPWILDLVATELQGMPSEFSSDNGLDFYFGSKAKARGLRQLGLETLEDQIDILAGGTLREQAASLIRTIQSDGSPAGIDDLYDAWRRADEAALDALISAEYPRDDGVLSRERLFLRRNRLWVDELSAMLAEPTTFFVVVGAGHLVGEESVVDLLERNGFTVERVRTVNDL